MLLFEGNNKYITIGCIVTVLALIGVFIYLYMSQNNKNETYIDNLNQRIDDLEETVQHFKSNNGVSYARQPVIPVNLNKEGPKIPENKPIIKPPPKKNEVKAGKHVTFNTVVEEIEEDEEGEIDYEQIIGKKNLLKLNIGELLCVFIKFANDTKEVINVSYDQLNDYEFKYKDAEKTTFTNKLKDLGDEGREVNNWFKKYRIGEWNVGQNGFEYDPEEYETKKNKAIEVEQLAKKYNKAIGDVDDIDVEDSGYERDLDKENDTEYNIQGIRGEDEDEYEDGYAEDLYDDYENSNNEFEE